MGRLLRPLAPYGLPGCPSRYHQQDLAVPALYVVDRIGGGVPNCTS